MRGVAAVAFVACLLLAGACEARRDRAPEPEAAASPGAPPERTADEQAIRGRSGAWDDAMLAKDVDRLLSMYAADAAVFEPGAAPISGGDALREHLAGLASLDLVRMETEIREVVVAESGELAFELGHSHREWDTPEGRMADRGPYLVVWRLEAGEWRIAREIFNSELPQGAGPVAAQR